MRPMCRCFKLVRHGEPMVDTQEPVRAPVGAEVLVRIRAAGVCHSDVMLYDGFVDTGAGRKIGDLDPGRLHRRMFLLAERPVGRQTEFLRRDTRCCQPTQGSAGRFTHSQVSARQAHGMPQSSSRR